MGKRDAAILDILNAEKKVEVASLAERLGVSSVTMREDLDALVDKNLVIREHGYALLGNPDDIEGRLARHYEEKLAIAQRAAELVSDGDTIFVENGSCCALLAQAVARTKRDVTIVTNSSFIAGFIRNEPGANISLLGGAYQRESQVNVGPMVRVCAQEFFVPLMFVGTDGWAGGARFTNSDLMRAEAVRSMAEQADEVVILTESEKFSMRGVVPLRIEGKVKHVITDAKIGPEVARELEAAGIEVIRTE